MLFGNSHTGSDLVAAGALHAQPFWRTGILHMLSLCLSVSYTRRRTGDEKDRVMSRFARYALHSTQTNVEEGTETFLLLFRFVETMRHSAHLAFLRTTT